jgi:type IV pilus assembly protein PilV
MKTRPRSPRRAARGAVMMEALIAALIFAIGVLGLVALQASMTQAQTVGKFRGDAIYLSDELVGLLWSDLGNLGRYTTANCGTHRRCQDWSEKVANALPGGTPAVAVNATTGVVTVSITWTTRNGTQRYDTTTAVVP